MNVHNIYVQVDLPRFSYYLRKSAKMIYVFVILHFHLFTVITFYVICMNRANVPLNFIMFLTILG